MSGEDKVGLGAVPAEGLKAPGERTETIEPGPRPSSPATPKAVSARTDAAFPVSGWDRYQYVRFLGQGGMGRVFLAYDPRLRRNVALKFVRDDEQEMSHRFLSEARAQAKVNHERVCKVYEVGQVEQKVFISMQYVDGQPLGALARELTVEQKALVLRDVCLGVHEAHRVGLIHRDIKPSNIMVERGEDGALKPYVMDFGLARDWNENLTASGSVLGTPLYMAPEQARGEVSRLDRRADVYSLGATLYYLLTGKAPIPGSNSLEILNNISTVEPQPPRVLDRELPEDLEAITLKCLEKDRSARYDSARALAEDLDRFLSGDPVLARTGPWYRLRKRLRKHRLLVSVATAALLAVFMALGWGLLNRREAAERERLAGRFTERVERMESLARYSALSPLHDIREDQKDIRKQMAALEEEIRQGGERARGPGHYALGRGHLALGDEAKAREDLESAWAAGFQEPRAAYALALVMGHLYQRAFLEAQRLSNPEIREARMREAERLYREPALAYLKRSDGVEVPSAEYVSALLAFFEGRLDDALARLDAIGGRLPWFYEAPTLRGDILVVRGTRHWNAGEREGALADFEAGRKAYATALAAAESVPSLHRSLGELEYAALQMELYGQGEVMPPYTRGLEAVSHALTAAPGDYEARVLEARFHRRMAERQGQRWEDVTASIQKAIASARAALESAPEGLQARLELGSIYSQWGQHRVERNEDPREQLGKALEFFESLRPEARDYVLLTRLGVVYNARATYEEQSGRDPLPDREKAIAAFLSATQLDERLPVAWINLGYTYFMRGMYPRCQDLDGDVARALSALEKARTLNPKHVMVHYNLARTHSLAAWRLTSRGQDPQHELATAIDSFQQAIALNPELPYLQNGLGDVFLDQAKDAWSRGADPFPFLEQSQAAFERAIALAPSQAFGYNNLGGAHADRARFLTALGRDPVHSIRLAVDAYRKALELTPEDALVWVNLGRTESLLAAHELAHGREPGAALGRASEALRKALERNPQQSRGWLGLGETQGCEARWKAVRHLAREEDFARAAESFQKALELAPEVQEFQLAFGRFCLDWASWRKASGAEPGPILERGLGVVKALLTAHPQWPEAQALEAGLLLMRGELQAREALRRVLALNPNLTHEWEGRLPAR